MNEIVSYQPIEPASEDVARIMEAKLADLKSIDGVDTFRHALTPAQRGILQKRLQTVTTTMRPLSYATALPARAGAIIARFLGTSYPNFNPAKDAQNADDAIRKRQECVAAYVTAMMDLPVFAIEEACVEIGAGRLTEIKVGGHTERVSLSFPPGPPLLAAAARARVGGAVGMEFHQLRRVLAVKQLRVPVLPPTERDVERVKAIHADITERLTAETRRAEEADRDRRDREGRAATEKTILKEYAELGIAPVRSQGILVSPSLLRSLGKGNHLRISDDDFQAKNRDQGS